MKKSINFAQKLAWESVNFVSVILHLLAQILNFPGKVILEISFLQNIKITIS